MEFDTARRQLSFAIDSAQIQTGNIVERLDKALVCQLWFAIHCVGDTGHQGLKNLEEVLVDQRLKSNLVQH